VPSAPAAGASTTGQVPAALRGRRTAWRDPRLWVGVVLVAASVVAGARLLAAADDTVQVWSAAEDLGAGQRVGPEDLVAQRVRFGDPAALGDYFAAEDALPAELELTRTVGAGELLPRAAVGEPDASGLVEVPVAVDAELVPPGTGPGDEVDLYVVAPAPEGATAGGAALEAATVVAAPDPAESFGATGKRQLVLAVPEADAPAFFALLSRYDAPTLTVVRRG
jgi:hypothetical protein